MGHNHSHAHKAVQNIKIAFFINLGFTLLELVGGYLTNSVAIMSDALHDLGDSFALGLAWFLERFSNKSRTNSFSFGFKRLSLFGALVNSIILLIGSVVIIFEAIPRLIKPEVSNAYGMFWLSIIGIIINGLGVYKTTHGKTLNERTISLHLLEDVLGWIAVLVVSVFMMFTNLQLLDPLLSLGITVYILWGVFKNLRDTTRLFLQAAPQNLTVTDIKTKLKQDSAICDVHDIHIWSLDGANHIMSAHVVVTKQNSIKDLEKIKQELKQVLVKMEITHSTLEFEFDNFCCESGCK